MNKIQRWIRHFKQKEYQAQKCQTKASSASPKSLVSSNETANIQNAVQDIANYWLYNVQEPWKLWLDAHKNDIFRYWVYKKVFTPYEKEQKFVDESCFEDDYATFARIVEAFPLVNGDLVLGLCAVDEDGPARGREDIKIIEYHRFSDIELEWCNIDNMPNDIDNDGDEIYKGDDKNSEPEV